LALLAIFHSPIFHVFLDELGNYMVYRRTLLKSSEWSLVNSESSKRKRSLSSGYSILDTKEETKDEYRVSSIEIRFTSYGDGRNCPEVFVDSRQIDDKSQGSAFDNYCLSGKLN
jgi:hypothetical protein